MWFIRCPSARVIGIFVGLIVGVAVQPPASATQPIQTQVLVDDETPAQGYDSVAMAVVAATNRFNPDSIAYNREHVGGIVVCKGNRFFYTHGVGEADQAPVQFSIPVRESCDLVALWHTHGGRDDNRRYFSSFDTRTAQATGKPFYMADYRGALKVFHPDDKTFTNRKMSRSVTKLPDGGALGRSVRDARGKKVWVATR